MGYYTSGTTTIIGLIAFIYFFSRIWRKQYIEKKRLQESRCQICGNDLGPELIVLEELRVKTHDYLSGYYSVDQLYTTSEKHIYRGDEAKRKIETPKQSEKKQCPTCGGFDIKYAYIEDGTSGDYCYRCRKSLKAMKDPKFYEKPETLTVHKIICTSCADREKEDLPETMEMAQDSGTSCGDSERQKLPETMRMTPGSISEKSNSNYYFIVGVIFLCGVTVFLIFFLYLLPFTKSSKGTGNFSTGSQAAKEVTTRSQAAKEVTASPQLTKKAPDSSQAAKEVTTMFQLAKSGNALAQADLGYAYYRGEGLPKDFVKAYGWFRLALNNGFEPAKKYLDILRPQMTPQQIAQVESEAAELLKQINKPNQ